MGKEGMGDSLVLLWIHMKGFRTEVRFKSTFIYMYKNRLTASNEGSVGVRAGNW